MNLLAAANYDPTGGAVSKVTTSLLAMTALDTTNLRLVVTVPAHGMLHIRMQCIHHGSTTIAQVMLGCLQGSTLRGRQIANINILQTAVATSMVRQDVAYTLTGLTPGSMTLDAAYGVEIVASANGAIKYGGPNDTTTNNGFGSFNFEIWDPRPLKLALDGGVNVTQWNGTAVATPATAGIPDVNVKNIDNDAASASGTVTFPNATLASTTNITAGTVTTATNVTTVNGLAANVITAASMAADASAEIADAVWDEDATGHQTQGTFGQAIGDPGADTDTIWGLANTNLDAAVSSRMATYTQPTGFLSATFPAGTIANTTNITAGTITTVTNLTNAPTNGDFTNTMKTSIGTAVAASAVASVTGNVGGNVTGSVGSVVGLTASNLDATVSSRLASASYTAPDNAGIDAIETAVADLPTNAELATALSGLSTFNAATDEVLANITKVNNIAVDGAGTESDPWGPV